ncbi:MAG: MerR family transcriptional regulator [Aquabacterium sp.]|nr:MerR family transcriptional regulator [Aquabacterium sp.]
MLTIGQASAVTQVSSKAIRHYESLDLIPRVQRRGTYRVYDQTQIQAIRLIRQAQLMGFTLAELRALGKDDCTPDWPRLADAITLKRQNLQRDIAALQQRDLALQELAQTIPKLIDHMQQCDDLAAHLLKNNA